MRWLGWAGIVAVTAGCPRVARLSFHFDLASGHGTLIAEGIGTDDPSTAGEDFAKLVDDYVLGDMLQEDHPAWRVGERRLFERDGQLFGIAEFGFGRPVDAGLYQHDRKSAYLWCAGADDQVIATSGEIPPPYPNCVMFDRKARTFDVTVGDDADTVSLLPQFQAWDGRPVAVDGSGGIGMQQGSSLSSLLPGVTVPVGWTSLGLPVAGGTVVYTNDSALQVSYVGASAKIVAAYEAALTAAGFARDGEDHGSSRWARGEETLNLSATEAGSTVIVSVAR